MSTYDNGYARAAAMHDAMEQPTVEERDARELWDACTTKQQDDIHRGFRDDEALDLIGSIDAAGFTDAELGKLIREKFNDYRADRLADLEQRGEIAATGTYGSALCR